MKSNLDFCGAYTAIVTPFTENLESIDYASLDRLVEFQIASNISGLVICGSTGEAATLSEEEYQQVIRRVVQLVNGRVQCIAGIGVNSTSRACELANFLNTVALDAVMLVAPAYNKPPQSGIIAHFAEVKKASRWPIIAYNVPGRSAVNIAPKTIEQMVNQQLIVGLKEASGSFEQVLDILSLVHGKISLLSGEDALTQSMMAAGGQGVISVVSNAVPCEVVQITQLCREGKYDQAAQLQLKLLPFIRAAFAESNPIPIKAALKQKGLISCQTPRLPLMGAEDSTCARLSTALEELSR